VEHAVVKLDGSIERQVSLADAVFNVDFKEPLVHQVVSAYLPAPVPVPVRKRIAQPSVVVEPSPGAKKALDAPEPAPAVARYGVAAARHLPRHPVVMHRRLTERCIAPRSVQSFRN